MTFHRLALALLLILALTAGTALAQDAPAASSEAAPTGLTLLFLLAGIGAILVIGLLSASKNSSNDGND